MLLHITMPVLTVIAMLLLYIIYCYCAVLHGYHYTWLGLLCMIISMYHCQIYQRHASLGIIAIVTVMCCCYWIPYGHTRRCMLLLCGCYCARLLLLLYIAICYYTPLPHIITYCYCHCTILIPYYSYSSTLLTTWLLLCMVIVIMCCYMPLLHVIIYRHCCHCNVVLLHTSVVIYHYIAIMNGCYMLLLCIIIFHCYTLSHITAVIAIHCYIIIRYHYTAVIVCEHCYC